MITLLAFLLTIAILVVVHEYGHYLAARFSGVKVLKFSVGFGKPVFSRRLGRDRTEWAVGVLPFGGYVKMLDEREGEVPAGEVQRTFNRASVWRRMAIVLAGPLANFLLALLVFWFLFMYGVSALRPVIATPEADSPAALAGLRNGDEVARVNGEPVRTFADLQLALLEAASSKSAARLELANGQQLEMDFTNFEAGEFSRHSMGIAPYVPKLPPVAGMVQAGGVAEQAGLRQGDRILAVNDTPVLEWRDFATVVRANPGREVVVLIETGGSRKSLSMTPASIKEKGKVIGRVGVAPRVEDSVFRDLWVEERHGPVAALGRAAAKTWEGTVFSLKMFGRMVTGQVSWRNLSGPVSIADYAGQSAQQGWVSFAGFLAVVSIGLGVLNLLPVPLLDGGHLMYYVVEVFQGRPVTERVMELGARAGMAIIGTLVFLALYNDFLRLLNG